MSRLRQEAPALAVLGLILAAGLVLRVLHSDHGLPYLYYIDEGNHFTKPAIEVFRDANHGYFQNPSTYTYLLHLVYRALSLPAGGAEEVILAYRANRDWIWIVSRGLAAVLCLAGVVGVYVAGRVLFTRRAALIAAAVLCFAFLPVAFSRMALTDVGTLLPVAVVLVCSVRVSHGAGLRACALAGAAAGLAVGFKYTAGLVLLVPALALALRSDGRFALRGGLVAAGCACAAFVLTNPYFVLDFDTALHQLRGQAELAGEEGKYGQQGDVGVLYYLDSLWWGLGAAAALAALVGAVMLAREDRRTTALLLLFPLALLLYLSFQSRFFGRWLLPAYPALALLAGHAVDRAALALRARAPRWELPALAAVLALLLWQPLAADARSLAVLGHRDTRDIAREWIQEHHRRGLRAVVEPAVPEKWYWPVVRGRPEKRDPPQIVNELVRDTQEEHVEYGRTLRPELLDAYRRRGYCTVVTLSLVRGRAATAEDDRALAYYDRLERESDVVFSVSPYRAGATPPEFSFDLSYSYYPPEFRRPGPDVRIHRLHDCTQGYDT